MWRLTTAGLFMLAIAGRNLSGHALRSGAALRARPPVRLLCAAGDGFARATDVWRPTVDDVERISWGKPAKKKGTGSRGVPHRLNSDERDLYEMARRKGWLEVAGSGWRTQRREAPLSNTYRSLCDARAQPCLVLHKSSDGLEDEVAVDLSPLRTPRDFAATRDWVLGSVGSVGSGDALLLVEDADEDDWQAMEGDADVPLGDDAWETQPIYHLAPFYLRWKLPRAEAKALAKTLAGLFGTAEGKAAKPARKSNVKAGKGRRHGGYGI